MEKTILNWEGYKEDIDVIANLGDFLIVKSITYPNKEIHFVEKRYTNAKEKSLIERIEDLEKKVLDKNK